MKWIIALCASMTFWGSAASAHSCENQAKASARKTRVVYTVAAKHSPEVIQSFGTCFLECVLGAIQDKILTDQRKQGVFFNDELIVSRLAPMLRLLSSRLDQFLKGESNTKTQGNALSLVNGGNLLGAILLVEGMDIPLFRFSFRGSYSGVERAILETQILLAAMLGKASDDEIRSTIRKKLAQEMKSEFNEKYNADKYFHIDSLSFHKEYYYKPVATTLKTVVDENIPTLAVYNAKADYSTEVSHAARVAGYEWDGTRVTGIVILDTNLHSEKDDLGTQSKMSLEEFEARGGSLHVLKIAGHLIDRKDAKIMPLD